MGGGNREGKLYPLDHCPSEAPLTDTTPVYRWQGQALEAAQEGGQGPRRRRQGLPREEARRYDGPRKQPALHADG